MATQANRSLEDEENSDPNFVNAYEIVGGIKGENKVNFLRPFRFRTQQRGKMKEEEFVKKLQGMMTGEEKQRIPVAQCMPVSTDEPKCVIKAPSKQITKPIDVKLHSDVRALQRAEFDHYVAEKLMLIGEYKRERNRQQKLAEEEEIRRFRKGLIPQAQLMPCFDRPFIPRRSTKQLTVPKEPTFQSPRKKNTPQSTGYFCC